VTQLQDDVFATEKVLLAQLSLERKIRLLTGATHWYFHGDDQVGLRPIVVSDGPAGVRGVRFRTDRPVSSLPAPIALAATWDPALVHDVAAALGREARSLDVDVLLAPNVNLVRTPLGGRAFECFSEDPWLTAGIAVAYIRGVQEVGVASCLKHFVANDSETERKIYDARIDETTLRELYLVPFEVCVREADPAMIMVGYNSVNGFAMTANRPLIRDLLKDEWGYGGVVLSDWTATRDTEESALAGLDLVMPGPDGPWGDRLVAAVEAGRVSVAEIDDKVLRLLRLARRVGALSTPDEAAATSQGSTPAPGGGSWAPHRVDPALLRQVAGRSFVLLRNRDGVLPLEGDARRQIAVVGPNAAWPRIQGGGSAMVLPVRRPGLVDALRSAAGDVTVELHPGCRPWSIVPEAEEGTLHDPVGGEPGVRLTVHAEDGALLYDARYERNAVTWWDDLPDAVHAGASSIVVRGRYRPVVSGPHLIGAAGLGRVAISIDGQRIAEATTLAPPELIGLIARPPELRVPVDLEAGREVEVRIDNHLPASLESGREVEARPGAQGLPTTRVHSARLVIFRLGIAAAPDEEVMIAEAVEAASRSTAAVVVVGSAESSNSEGYDRDSLALPGRQDELVRRVAAANPRTVVVVNSGSSVLMPWADEVAAVLQVWLPGQAMGEAIADVLLGVAEPGGRLPVTVPRREADCPVLAAEPHFGKLEYSEGLLVGYRGYDRAGTDPLFCFGHGLGYTEWEYLALRPATTVLHAGEDLPVTVTVRNVGGRRGREIVQLYLEPLPGAGDPARPARALAAFAPVDADPGEEATVALTVPSRAFARFRESPRGWGWPAAQWRLRAGRSSRDLPLSEPVRVS
jgi:beta-glucosidase